MNDLEVVYQKYPKLRTNGDIDQYLDESLLNTMANFIEEQGQKLDLQFRILGGKVYRSSRYIKMECYFISDVRKDLTVARKFNQLLERAFNVEKAGFDETEPIIWLWKFRT